MTAQISDQFLYNSKIYIISAIENEKFFDVKQYGFRPLPRSSACWRGYFNLYTIANEKLLLDSLNVSIDEPFPLFCGIQGERGGFYKYDHIVNYKNVNMIIPYTGGIVIGQDIIREFYVNVGFQSPHCYEKVYELRFIEGNLIDAIDCSSEMGNIRKKIRKYYETKSHNRGVHVSKGKISAFEGNVFSLSYEAKWKRYQHSEIIE